MVLAGRTKLKSFQKLFGGNIFLYLLNIFATAAPKLKQKNIKNYSSILSIVDHRNWLDDSPPLNNDLTVYELQLIFIAEHLCYFEDRSSKKKIILRPVRRAKKITEP